MVQSGTYTSHPAAFLDQPFAAPHQSAGSEVPSDSFPRGKPRGANFSRVRSSRGRRVCRPGTSTPMGRFALRADSIRPYGSSGEAGIIQPTALSHQLARSSGCFLETGVAGICSRPLWKVLSINELPQGFLLAAACCYYRPACSSRAGILDSQPKLMICTPWQ